MPNTFRLFGEVHGIFVHARPLIVTSNSSPEL